MGFKFIILVSARCGGGGGGGCEKDCSKFYNNKQRRCGEFNLKGREGS